MSGGGGRIKETPEQKAMAARIRADTTDYFTRWVPLQNRAIQTIENVEPRRQRARNEANTEAMQATGAGLQEAGKVAPLGSGRQVAVLNEVVDRSAALRGGAKNAAVEGVNDGHVRGLSEIVGMGLRQKGRADAAYESAAALSARRAAQAQSMADQRAAGRGQLIGTAVGTGLALYGAKAMTPKTITPQGSFSADGSLYRTPDGFNMNTPRLRS